MSCVQSFDCASTRHHQSTRIPNLTWPLVVARVCENLMTVQRLQVASITTGSRPLETVHSKKLFSITLSLFMHLCVTLSGLTCVER